MPAQKLFFRLGDVEVDFVDGSNRRDEALSSWQHGLLVEGFRSWEVVVRVNASGGDRGST